MSTAYDDAFIENAIALEDALDAADRFFLRREGRGFVMRLERHPAAGVNLVSKAELMELVDHHMERGGEIRLSD
jgi:hypothetical protein